MRESLKPIEPGCLAMVVVEPKEIHPSSSLLPPKAGEVVTVIDRSFYGGPDTWTLEGYGSHWITEDCLIRIDPDEDQRKAWEREAWDDRVDAAAPELARRVLGAD